VKESSMLEVKTDREEKMESSENWKQMEMVFFMSWKLKSRSNSG
jgi:hypothetical protein